MIISGGRASKIFGVRPFSLKIIIGICVLLLMVFLWYADQLVVVLEPEGNRTPQVFAVHKDEEWYLLYTHSVQRTPVWEYFRVNGANDLTMTHTVYSSLGVGLPYAPSEGKYVYLAKEGRFDLTMNRPYKTVKLRTAVQAMHKVVHDQKVYDLCKLYGQGTLVEIKALRRYEFWLENLGF